MISFHTLMMKDVQNRSMVGPWKADAVIVLMERHLGTVPKGSGMVPPHLGPQVIVLIMFVFAIVFDNAVAGALRAP